MAVGVVTSPSPSLLIPLPLPLPLPLFVLQWRILTPKTTVDGESGAHRVTDTDGVGKLDY